MLVKLAMMRLKSVVPIERKKGLKQFMELDSIRRYATRRYQRYDWLVQ